MRIFDELKRRNVFRVGIAYVLLGWLVIRVTDTVAPALNLPSWTLAFVTWIGIIGLPFALFFAWAFELTPDGIRRETGGDNSESLTDTTGRKLDLALIGLLIAAIGFMAWGSLFEDSPGDARLADTPAKGGDASTARPATESIAVLPLINMSAVSDNAYFAGGVHEEILTNLSRIEGLRVISRTTALRYINSDLSLHDIGRELGARYIVEGSVRRVDNHVRITVQLIDAIEDAHLWASNYDRELVEVFATQSEVAREITNSLHLEIQPETVGTLDDMPTRSVKAYDLYMKAISINRSEPESESTLRRSRALLDAAVEEDPDFVEAWAYLNEILDFIARTIIQNDWFGDTEAERDASFAEVRKAATRALDKAVALDPDNVMSLLAQASDYVAEQESATYSRERRKFIDRAIELEPDNAVAWFVLAWWYRLDGDIESATAAFNKALELDPLHARIVQGSLQHFRLSGDEEMTRMLADRLIQIAPEMRDDPTLSKIPVFVRLNNLFALFTETADESIIETYAAELANGSDQLGIEVFKTIFDITLLQLRNDLDGLLKLKISDLPTDGNIDEIYALFRINFSVLAAQRILGRTDEAAATARHILEMRKQVGLELGESRFALLDRMTSAAHAALGNEKELRDLRSSVFEDSQESFNIQQIADLISVSHLDADWVVQRLLEEKARHSTWFGTDVVAALHVVCRQIIVHPDMQKFYVDEGKWVDYLAKRVPEYAKYRQ